MGAGAISGREGPAGPARKPLETRPLVTAIIPAFNAEPWIEATLRSVAAQTWRVLEILIVDDGSTDRTAAIAQAFCAGEPRARLIRKPNGGVASARNRGIAEAAGEWLAPIDADDLWHATYIEKMVEAALAAPERPGFVYAWHRRLDMEGRVTGSCDALDASGRALRRLAYRNPVGNGSAILIDAAAARAARGYDETLHAERAWGGEDWLLQMELAARHPVALVPEYLVGYRLVPGAMSSDNERMHRSWQAGMRRFTARHGAIPGPAARRDRGMRWFMLAEAKAGRREFAAMAALLARSIHADPLRISLRLVARKLRFARRVLRTARPPGELPAFADCPTTGPIGGDRHACGPMERLLARLDRRRFRNLARDESPLAQGFGRSGRRRDLKRSSESASCPSSA